MEKFKEFKNSVYSNEIVYGAKSEYQGDILRDEYELHNFRVYRGFDLMLLLLMKLIVW